MRQTDHEGTWQIVTAIVIATVLALLLWNLTIRNVDAAPLERTCYLYPVTLHNPSCALGWCAAFETLHLDGLRTLTVRVSGWHLNDGQIKLVRVCR